MAKVKKIRKKGKLVDAPSKVKKAPPKRPENKLKASDPAREELRQRSLKKDPKFAGDVEAKEKEADVKATAQRSFDIGKEKERLKEADEVVTEEAPTDKRDLIEESGSIPTITKKPVEEKYLTETITQTDETGFTREIEMPIGTSAKIAEANARREGRVPYTELPAYQQFLASAAVTSVSPKVIQTAGGKFAELAKPMTTFMKSALGKFVGATVFGSGIITWLASDNIIGTMGIYTRDLADDVTFGTLSKQAALDKIDEGDAFVEKARNFIRTATMINPTLWPFRSIILANADAAELAIQENKNRIRRA